MKTTSPVKVSKIHVEDRTAWWFFATALLVYAATRIISIEQFPIYFFCDEAMHAVQFRELMNNGWHGIEGPHELLPAYYLNGGMFNLSLSVFVQGVASLIGGQNVATVRITSALVSLTGGIALALSLRRIFRLREWWSVIGFLTVIPCWFLHSRTGFETVLMVSSYCWFIYAYLRYRMENPSWVVLVMVAGAFTFYAYSPGQGVMFVTGIVLLGADIRYHWKHRRWAVIGLGFGLLLFAPYVRFRLQHPEMMSAHLRTLGSYWTEAAPLSTKLLMFVGNYLAGFSPRFWFTVGGDEAVRHVVPYQAHIPALLTPFALIGLVRCVVGFRNAPYRVVLAAIVASPFSSALVAPMVTRMLAFVVPFSLCTALGFEWLMHWIKSPRLYLSGRTAAFATLSLAGFGMLANALENGPTFPKDYGLYGAQWGATKLFRDTLPRYLKSDPGANLMLTHVMFNSPDVFPRFFGWKNNRRVMFASLDDICAGETLPDFKDLVLLGAQEFETLKDRAQVQKVEVRERIAWPDGRTGYYLVHLQIAPEFAASIRSDPNRRPRPEWERLVVSGLPCSVLTTGAGPSRASALFGDGGSLTRAKGEAINVEIVFDQVVALDRIQIEAETERQQQISLWSEEAGELVEGIVGKPGQRRLDVGLSQSKLDFLRIELSGQPDVGGKLLRIQLKPKAP